MNLNIIYHAPFEHFIVENFECSFKQFKKDFHNEIISFKSNKQFEKKDFHNETILFESNK